MMERECLREREVVRAIVGGAWPDGVDGGLREHAAACHVCGAAAELATLLAGERDRACAEARVPSAAIAWWRAELRARQEANRAAGRPIAAVVGITLASMAGFVAALVPAAWSWLHAWAGYVATLFGAVRVPPPTGWTALSGGLASASPLALAFWLAVVIWLVVAPLALYFVFADD